MKQNHVSLVFDADRLERLDLSLDALEAELTDLKSVRDADVRGLLKMGDGSEPFCRKVVDVLVENPSVVPASLGLDEARADLAALDALRPRLRRLQVLVERAQDTEMLLGSDIYSTALEGYGLLKVTGQGAGLEAMRKELGARWRNRGGSDEAPDAPPLPEMEPATA